MCRGLASTTPSLTMPMPSLLALPSNPMTVGMVKQVTLSSDAVLGARQNDVSFSVQRLLTKMNQRVKVRVVVDFLQDREIKCKIRGQIRER